MRKRIMAMLLALVMVVGVLPVAALAEEPVSDTEPTTVPTETTAPTEATALAEAVQTDVSQYALTDGISTYDAFNCYVALIPDSTNAKPTGFKVKVGDTVNGYKVLSLNSRTYEVHIDIGVLQSESALPKFRIPLPEEIWTGVKATDSTWVLCVNHWKPGDTMKLDRGGNQMRYYSMGTEWYFALKFDANGGSGAPAAQTYTTDTASETSYTFTIPKTVPARKGYTFQGWSFEKNGTASYQPGETCTLTRPKDGAIASTLYAVWEEAVPSKPEWSDIRGEMQKVSVHVTCINPDVNHTDKTYPYQEDSNDTIGAVQDNAGSYTCTVTVHLGRYRTNYNSDFNREHQFASSLTADVVLQYNGTGWVIASALPLELKLTCGSAPTPDPPGQDVLGRLLVQVECDAITYHFTKTYQLDDGDYRLEKVDDNTYTVTVTADKYVEKYNIDYGVHTLFDNNTKTIKLVYRYGAWTVVGSNGVTFNVSCEQKYTVTYTDGVDGEVIFKDQVYYKKPGEKTPAFRGTPTRTGYKFIGWEPAVSGTVTANATYTAQWVSISDLDPAPELVSSLYMNFQCTNENASHDHRSEMIGIGFGIGAGGVIVTDAAGNPVYNKDGNITAVITFYQDSRYLDEYNKRTGVTHRYADYEPKTKSVDGVFIGEVFHMYKKDYPVVFDVVCSSLYTVTYKDGANGTVFADDVHSNLNANAATPAFVGGTPTRTGYVFIGWNPAVAATVTGNATYTAVWEAAQPEKPALPEKDDIAVGGDGFYFKCISGVGHASSDQWKTRLSKYLDAYNIVGTEAAKGADGRYFFNVEVTVAPYLPDYTAWVNRDHTICDGEPAKVTLTFYYNETTKTWAQDEAAIPYVRTECKEDEIPDPASGAFDNWNIRIKCVRDTSHDLLLRYSHGTYRFERHDDPQYGRLVFDAASYLAKYNEIFKDDHGNHGLNDATAAVTLELAYKDGQWQPKVPNALPTIQVTCANEPEAPEKPTHEDLKNIIASVKLQCVTAPDPAHADQLYSLNENAYDVTNPTLEDGQYTCVVTVKSDYYLNNLNQYDLGPHTISGDTRKNIKLIWDSQNKNWAAEDGKKQKIVFNIQCETLTVTYTDGVDGVEVFKDVVRENLPYGTNTPAFYTKDPFRKGYVFTGWNPAVAATVTGNATYAAVWEEDANGNGTPDKDEEKYTVTYTDGVENEEIFADQVYGNLLSGTATPAFNGTPTRTGYVFGGWNPAVAAKVTGSQTYTATWKVDANGNGIPDDEEDKYTVTYTDGVENEEIFADQVYGNLLPDTATPAFNGTPTRTGYVFGGWNPAVAAKVTGSQTYTATWKVDANGNGIADDEEDKFTVTYTDGMDGKIFVNQVYENLLPGTATPAFNGTPTRTGYVFGGWNPAVAAKVTESKTYTATWKADANGNGIADDEEDKYTVTYTDGVKGKAFADQVYDNLLSGTDTPAFNGKPTRKGYTFVSWTPKVTDTVTKTVTYTATWKANSGKDNVPKTGDSGIVPVLGSVLLFSFCGAAACVFDRKRKHI